MLGCVQYSQEREGIPIFSSSASLIEIRGFVIVLITLGQVHISLGEVEAAVEYVYKGIDLLKHTTQSQPESFHILRPLLARSLVCMGVVYDAQGKFSRAIKIFEESMKIQMSCLGRCDVDVAATMNRMGGIHERRGSYCEAMVCYTEALRLYRSQLGLGCSPLDVAVTLNNIGFIHHQWKQYGRALTAYREALAIFSLLLGACHRNVTATKYNIAQAFVARRSSIRGIQLLKQVNKWFGINE